MYGRNGQSICLLSPFFCPSSKIAQPKYAKGASERARSASVYGIWFFPDNTYLLGHEMPILGQGLPSLVVEDC